MSFARTARSAAGLLFAASCAARAPSPATQAPSAGSLGSAAPGTPSPPEEALTWQAIPFPDASFTGKVLATAAPSAFRAGELLVIWVPFTAKAQARCTIVRSALDRGGSLEALVAAPGTVGTRLRDLSVDGLEVSSETGMLSLLAKRDNGSWVEVAGYRDRRKTLVCAADGARDLPMFRRMAESLVSSLQPAEAPPPASVVELCVTKIGGETGDGSPGFVRTEIIEDGPRTMTRVTGFVAFRDGPAGLDLMEESEDEGAVEGRVSELRTLRLFGGRTDLDARLSRDAAGRYRALVSGRRGQRYDGPVRVRTSDGLPSRGAIRERIKNDLLGQGADEVRVEAFDPLETPAEAAVRTYVRGGSAGELRVTEGTHVARQRVDADGFVQSEEASLAAGAQRSSTCHRERPAPPSPERARQN
jgi:hypothetical protein